MLLLLKLVLVPSLVAGVTLAVRRWGLRVGGVLTALPISAGPTLCFYAIEQGNAFAASAGRATLLGLVANAAFCLAYTHSARRVAWPVSTAAGWTAFAIVVWMTRPLPDLRGAGEFAMAAAALLLAARLLPRAALVPPAAAPPRFDLPLRMAAAAASVILLTALADWLGARLSGIFAAFPVVTMILGAFIHAQRGPAAVSAFYRAMLRGLLTFAVFCLVFSTALGPGGWTLFQAVTAALAAQLALQAAIILRLAPPASAR